MKGALTRNMDEVYLTAEGAETLRNELEELKGPKREDLARRLKIAIDQGDLSENADYIIAKEEQGFLEGRIREIEAILRDAVIIEAAQTIAFHKESVKVIWKSKRYKPAYGTPAPFSFKGKLHLATVKTDGLVILDGSNGKTVASKEWKTRFSTNANTPIVKGDKIFISTGYQRGCALFKFTGAGLEQIYTNKSMSNHMSSCVLIGTHLYGFMHHASQFRK